MASLASRCFARTITQREDVTVSGQSAMAATGQILLSAHTSDRMVELLVWTRPQIVEAFVRRGPPAGGVTDVIRSLAVVANQFQVIQRVSSGSPGG